MVYTEVDFAVKSAYRQGSARRAHFAGGVPIKGTPIRQSTTTIYSAGSLDEAKSLGIKLNTGAFPAFI